MHNQLSTETSLINMANFDAFLSDLRDLIDTHLAGEGGAPVAAPKAAAAKPKKEAEAAPTETSDRRAELMKTNIRTLRKQAIALGFDEDEVSEAEKEDLVDSILSEEEEADETAADETEADDTEAEEDEDEDEADEEEADEDEEDEEEEEDDEDDDYTREDLEGMTLTALKKICREEYEQEASDLKGLDKEDLIAFILGEDVEEEDEDEEEEEAELTEEDLEAMSLAEVKAVAKEYGIKVKPGMKKAAIIAAIFEE